MPSFTLARHKLHWSHSWDCPWTLTPAEAQSNWIHPSAGIAIKSAAPDYTHNLQSQSKSWVRSQKPWNSLPDQLMQEYMEDTPKDTHLGEEQPSLLLVEHPTYSIQEFHTFCVRLWSISQWGISSSSVQSRKYDSLRRDGQGNSQWRQVTPFLGAGSPGRCGKKGSWAWGH